MKTPEPRRTATPSTASRTRCTVKVALGAGVLALGVLALSGLASCEEKSPPPMPTPRAVTPPAAAVPPAPAGQRAPGTPVGANPAGPGAPGPGGSIGTAIGPNQFAVGGILVTMADGWKPQAPANSPFSPIADLRFATESGEARAAFFAVEGGSSTMNIERWRRQMKLPEGTDAQVSTAERNGLKLTRIDMTGEYSGMTSGGQAAPAQANTRFVGVYLEGGAKPIQVRLTGPKPAVDAALASFEQMLAGMTKPK